MTRKRKKLYPCKCYGIFKTWIDLRQKKTAKTLQNKKNLKTMCHWKILQNGKFLNDWSKSIENDENFEQQELLYLSLKEMKGYKIFKWHN